MATGLFYGAISSFLRFIFDSSETPNPLKVPNFIENVVLIVLLTLVLLSVGMGKHLDDKMTDRLLKFITALLCLINFFVVIFAISEFFDSVVTVLLFLIFAFTFILPPMLFNMRRTCQAGCTYFISMLVYLVMMPLYLIVFQIYSYANLHDVSWGNRGASKD